MANTNCISAPTFAVLGIFVLGMLMACVFIGIYPIDNSTVMLQMGISFAAISITIAGFYILRNRVAHARLKHGPFCQSKGSRGRCYDSCIRISLCLYRQENASGDRSDTSSFVTRDVVGIWAQLESLQQELNRLVREYAQIEPLAVDREYMRQSRSMLLEDQAVLSEWMEGVRVPTWEHLEIMNNRLETVNAIFEVERERHRTAGHATPPVSSIAYSDRAFRSDGSHVGLPNMTGNQADITAGTPLPRDFYQTSQQSTTSLGRHRPTLFSDYRLPAYLTGQEEHPVSLPPYADDPPSYEETMNMPHWHMTTSSPI